MSLIRRFNTWVGDETPVNARGGQLLVNTTDNTISAYINDSWTPLGVTANEIISQIVGAAPSTLNTLDEIAQALNDNPNVLDLYLTSVSASSTYLTQANATSTYLTQASASTTYAPKTWINPTSATAGQVLVANGSGGSSFQTPAASGGMTLISEGTSTNVAQLEITNIPTTYHEVIVEFEVLRLASGGRVHIQYGVNGFYTNTTTLRGGTQVFGGTNFGVANQYLSTSSDAATVGTSDGLCLNDILKGYDQASGQNTYGYVKFKNWNAPYSRSPIEAQLRYVQSGTDYVAITNASAYLGNPTRIKLFSPQGNISNIEYKVYGVS